MDSRLWRSRLWLGIGGGDGSGIRIGDIYAEAFDDALEATQSGQELSISGIADLAGFTRRAAGSREDALNVGASAVGTRVQFVAFDLALATGHARTRIEDTALSVPQRRRHRSRWRG